MTGMALRVVRTDGILALYSGLSASLCRQVCGGCQSRTPHDPSGLPYGLSPAVGIQAVSISVSRLCARKDLPGRELVTPGWAFHGQPPSSQGWA